MQGESLPSRYPGGERAVNAEWLQRRESAFVVVRADYETQRAQAQADYYASGVGSASGDGSGGDPGFDEIAFRSQYVAQLASRAAGSGPLRTALQTLGECYGSDAATLLGSRTALLDELVRTASSDHALNAGPAPSGIAMGDAGGLAMLDFYLADAQIRTLIDTYGGPTPARDPLALEQVRLLGPTRFEQLMRLHNAMGHVRWLYTHAMTQAERSGQGPGWVDRVHTVVEGSSVEGESTSVATDGPTTTRTVVEHVFDHDAFTAWYIAQPGTANRAFRDFYGASHTAAVPGAPGESGQSSGPPSFTQRFDNPAWVMADGAMNRDGLEQLNINDPPQLNDRSAVFFDLEAGWVTPQGNVHENNTLETVVGVIFVVAVSYVSANTLGPWAVEAVGLAGSGGGAAASIGVAGASYATTSTAAAMVTAGITGAAAATASGLVNGNVTLRDVLRGALSGALSAGLLQGLNTALPDLGAVGTIGARMTIQGGIQALLGGHFRDGAIAGFASGLAQLTTDSMNEGIADALRDGTMSPEQAYAARAVVRVIGSAVRAAGNPSDPLHAFASDFLTELLQQAGAEGTPGNAGGAGEGPPAATVPLIDEAGLPMPGTVDTSASPTVQAAQLAERLREQGMPPDEAAAQAMHAVGLSLPPAAAPDASVPADVEIIGQRLPRDAAGNRYETDAAGNQVVILAGGGMLALNAADAIPIGEGLVVPTWAGLQRLAQGTASILRTVLNPATLATVLVGAPGNLGSSTRSVELNDYTRFEVAQGSLYGSVYDRTPGGDWIRREGGYIGMTTPAGFAVLSDEEYRRLSGLVNTPMPTPPGTPGTPPITAAPPPNDNATPGQPSQPVPPLPPPVNPIPEPQNWRDLLVESRIVGSLPSNQIPAGGLGGPGSWVQVEEYMSESARAYQARVTGAPRDSGYAVTNPVTGNPVVFDGYTNGVLLDAKDQYAQFLDGNKFADWFTGGDALRAEARRQEQAANGVSIEWRFSNQDTANFFATWLAGSGFSGIKVVYQP